MIEESESLNLEHLRDLEVWACSWYEEAIAANFVRLPYLPDEKTIKILQGYYHPACRRLKPRMHVSEDSTDAALFMAPVQEVSFGSGNQRAGRSNELPAHDARCG